MGRALVLVLKALWSASAMALLPILSGLLHALANIATRRWFLGESAESIVATFLVTIGGCGLIGMLLLSTFAPYVPRGVEGFGLRGVVRPDRSFLLRTLLLAVIACIGIAMVTRAYQMADTGRIAVLEYVSLPISAFWGWLLWDQSFGWSTWAGIGLIASAGVIILISPQRQV